LTFDATVSTRRHSTALLFVCSFAHALSLPNHLRRQHHPHASAHSCCSTASP